MCNPFYFSAFKPGRFASELGLDKPQIMKAELLAAVERLGEILPPNTLDQLIDSLGGPEYVAEVKHVFIFSLCFLTVNFFIDDW